MNFRQLGLVLVFACVLALVVGCTPDQSTAGSGGLHSTVPAVVGMRLDEARAKLRESGYKVGTVTPNRASSAGTVSQQQPVAGTSVARGGEVNLVVDDGR